MLASVTVVPKLKIVESTLNVEPEPNSATALTEMVCPSSAPTWNVMALEPVSTAMSLNLVSLPIRLISAQSCETSAVIDALSDADSVPLLYWTASSRTRWSMACTSLMAPSAVCTSETASCELRWA